MYELSLLWGSVGAIYVKMAGTFHEHVPGRRCPQYECDPDGRARPP